MIVRGIAATLALVSVALIARRLGPDGYGWFAIVTAVAAIFLGPLLRAITAVIPRSAHGADAPDPTATVTRVLFAAIVMLLSIAVVWHVFGDPSSARRIVVTACVLATALSLLDLARRHASLHRAIQRAGALRAANAALVCSGAWLLHNDADPALAVGVITVAAVITAVLFGAPAWRATLRGRFNANHLAMMRGSAPLIALTAFGAALLHWVDRLFLMDHVSQADLGIYAAAVDLSQLLFVPLTALLYVAWLPRLTSARTAAAAPERTLIEMRYALAVMTLLLPTLIGLVLLRVELVAAVFGGAYAAQAGLLPWVAIAAVLGALRCAVLDTGLYREGRTRSLLRNVAISAFVNVALNALFVPRYGVMAAIAAALASQSLAFFLAWRASRDIIAWRMPRVQFERIAFCCAAMAFAVLLLPNEFVFAAKLGVAAIVYACALWLVNGAGVRDWLGPRARRMD